MEKSCCKCGRIIPMTERYCDEHKREDWQRRNRRNAVYGYASENWQRVRRERLERAGYRCELRLPGCTETAATHVHLDPRLKGDHRTAEVADCRACCASCSGSVDAARAHDSRGAGSASPASKSAVVPPIA